MAFKSFNQYDPAWANKYYRGNSKGTSTMKGSGCGPSSCACLYYHFDKTTTPWKVAEWMMKHGYATNGQGTIHGGINNFFTQHNVKCKWLTASSGSIYGKKGTSYETTFKKAIQNGNAGIILFGKGDFTSGGHYCAVQDYKDGKYYLNDPGARSKDGWYRWSSFEKQIKHLWVVTIPKAPAKKTSTSTSKTKKTTKTVKATVATSKGKNLYMRKSNKKIIKKLASGTTVTVVKKSAKVMTINGIKYTMAKIKVGSKTGYVAQRYLKF